MTKQMLMAFFVVAQTAFAQPAAVTPAPRQRLTPQALWEMKRLGSPQLAPDGRSVVFKVSDFAATEGD